MKPHPWYHHFMFRWLLYVALTIPLLGQDDCEGDPPPPPNAYCSGAVVQPEPGAFQAAVDWVAGGINAILYGEPASERWGTVRVNFGGSYCSGTVIAPHTVLTAAHCGYGPATTHEIVIDGVTYDSNEKLPHPDYMRYVHEGFIEGRKSDLMLLYTEAPLPEPYIGNWYSSHLSSRCRNIWAQGWGRTEANPEPCPDGESKCLREADYSITQEDEKTISVIGGKPGRICFGDSGGPLYADTGRDLPFLAGVASTTMSSDCTVGSTHVKVTSFATWLYNGAR